MNFYVAILILKKKSNIFSILCFSISRELKMQMKCKKKRFVQCVEKVLWLTECANSGLWSFVLEISHWTMLHGWVGQWSWWQSEASDENNQFYTIWEIAGVFKKSKSSTENHLHQLGYVDCFDVWVPYKLSKNKTLLTYSRMQFTA